jgi:hypothetical protein
MVEEGLDDTLAPLGPDYLDLYRALFQSNRIFAAELCTYLLTGGIRSR